METDAVCADVLGMQDERIRLLREVAVLLSLQLYGKNEHLPPLWKLSDNRPNGAGCISTNECRSAILCFELDHIRAAHEVENLVECWHGIIIQHTA